MSPGPLPAPLGTSVVAVVLSRYWRDGPDMLAHLCLYCSAPPARLASFAQGTCRLGRNNRYGYSAVRLLLYLTPIPYFRFRAGAPVNVILTFYVISGYKRLYKTANCRGRGGATWHA